MHGTRFVKPRSQRRLWNLLSNELQVEMVPMTDGGEGFVDILTQGARGEFESFSVADSLGIKKKSRLGFAKLAG